MDYPTEYVFRNISSFYQRLGVGEELDVTAYLMWILMHP